MKLEQTSRRESILVYGTEKLGKSTCWVDIADTFHRSGNRDPHFYVIDTDFGVGKLLDEGYGHIEDDGMLTVYSPMDFGELLVASKEIQKRAVRGDWIVIDMLSYCWAEAQAFYIQGVYGDEPEDYFIQMRKEVVAKKGKDKRAFGGHEGTDWNFITKIYKRFELPMTLKTPANVFGVTEEKKLNADRGDSTDTIKKHRNVGGMAPVGQKGIGHRFDTVLRMTMRANGKRELTMVGDRGRQRTVWDGRGDNVMKIGQGNKGFTRRYLIEIAGWKGGDVRGGKSQRERSEGKSKSGSKRKPALSQRRR